MKWIASLIIGIVLVGVSGCAVDQDKEIQTYRKELDFSTTQPAITGETLTLRQAVYLANQQNERLSSQGETYLQALIGKQRTISSFFPNISLSPSYFRRQGVAGAAGGTGQTHALDAPVVGNINLFNGFQDVARLKVSDLSIEQQKALLLDAQESLLADVVRVFYQVLRDEEQLRVLENSLQVQAERVRDMQGRAAAGVARPLDVAQSQAQASGTKVTLINAQNALRNDRNALAFLIGLPATEMKLIDDYQLPLQHDRRDELEATAITRRQDYAGAIKGSAAARENVEVAFRQYYPSVSLNLDGYLYRESIPDSRAWDGLLSANLPLFSGNRIHADVRAAWSRYRQSKLFESQLLRQIKLDVHQSLADLESSVARLDELNLQVRAAQQAFDQADASYNTGLATNLERIVAQDRLLTAQLALAGEQFNRKIFFTDLLRAIGALREELDRKSTTRPTTSPRMN